MTQTTGQISAKDVSISLGTQDISGSSNKITLKPKRGSGRTFTFDGDWALLTAGKLEWSGAMELLYTEIASEALDKIWSALENGSTVSLSVSPKGGTAGDWSFVGDVLITEPELAFDGTSGDPVIVTCGFEGSGTLTKGVVST